MFATHKATSLCSYTECIETVEYTGHRGRDRMVVGFTTAYAISTYHK